MSKNLWRVLRHQKADTQKPPGYCWRTYLRRDNSQHTPGNPDRIRRISYRSAALPDAERLGDNSMAEKREAERRC